MGLAGLILLGAADTRAQQAPAVGFQASGWSEYQAREKAAVEVPTPRNARAWLRRLTEEPHVAGTAADYDTAVFVRDKLREWGWKADLAEYECLLNYPVAGSVQLEVVAPERLALPVTEAPEVRDKDSASGEAFPAFHGYGVSGDVTAQVVYANYGRPEDFDKLSELGIDVRRKIVLVRYGGLFRGLKLLNAQKRGAVGLLIYSDPADDGYMRGDVYPNGPYRPPSGIQRGSVQFLSLGPGDPSTPGWPSVRNGKRLPIDPTHGFPLLVGNSDAGLPPRADPKWEERTNLKRLEYFATIPSLPISYESARPIIDQLAGPNVPDGWQGGLPFPYHVGPGPVEVRMAVNMDYKVRTIWNVIARLEGASEPERWVFLSNHRDAWAYGAVDPGSGTAATLETCRALGEAVKAGWKPRRSILYASWDGEEYGLLGSTEWAEDLAGPISRKALLLLNVDSAVSGTELSAGGVPSLRDLFVSAAGAERDPRSDKPISADWIDKQRKTWAEGPLHLDDAVWQQPPSTGNPASPTQAEFQPALTALGSGSDYTAFLDHLGVPSMDVDLGGRYGVYHSVYDNFFWMEHFGDPEFLTHATAARLYTRLIMRSASAEVVPLTFAPYARFLREQVDDVRLAAARKARSTGKPVEISGLAAVIAAVRSFEQQAGRADEAVATLLGKPQLDAPALERLNESLTQVERAFLHPAGLPGRPWFRHTIFAPGVTTGYAAWTLPGLRQAVQDNDARLMAEQAQILAGRIEAAAQALAKIPALAEAAGAAPRP